ncbi:MAG: transcriptional repressor LexA [Clostridia bacterium]
MTKSSEMSEKLNAIYEYIATVTYERGYAPTIREMCEEFNIKSTSSVSYYLRKLEAKNLITIDYGKSRAITLTNSSIYRPKNSRTIPLLGTIAAGEPIFAAENYDDIYTLPDNLFSSSGDIFMLNVRGTSMIDVGINDGDKILVRHQSHAENGQIIAALLDGENATVKRYYNDERGIRLHPENKDMADIYPTEMNILGVVVGLIRTEIR